MARVDPAVDDGPDDPVATGVVGAPGRVGLHGRRRTVDLGLQGVVRPDPEDDRRAPAFPGGPAVLSDPLPRGGPGTGPVKGVWANPGGAGRGLRVGPG